MVPQIDAETTVVDLLRHLPSRDMDAPRVGIIRARMHHSLSQRARANRAGVIVTDAFRRVLEPTIVGSVSVVYLVEVVSRALGLLGR